MLCLVSMYCSFGTFFLLNANIFLSTLSPDKCKICFSSGIWNSGSRSNLQTPARNKLNTKPAKQSQTNDANREEKQGGAMDRKSKKGRERSSRTQNLNHPPNTGPRLVQDWNRQTIIQRTGNRWNRRGRQLETVRDRWRQVETGGDNQWQWRENAKKEQAAKY